MCKSETTGHNENQETELQSTTWTFYEFGESSSILYMLTTKFIKLNLLVKYLASSAYYLGNSANLNFLHCQANFRCIHAYKIYWFTIIYDIEISHLLLDSWYLSFLFLFLFL